MSEISDNEVKVLKWIMIKNIVLIITTALSVFFISPWMFFMLLCYTTYSNKDGEEKQL
jgi:isopentenyldiphosphate isomerase